MCQRQGEEYAECLYISMCTKCQYEEVKSGLIDLCNDNVSILRQYLSKWKDVQNTWLSFQRIKKNSEHTAFGVRGGVIFVAVGFLVFRDSFSMS